MDNDGINELMAGACNDDDGGIERGAVYLLYLNNTGGVKRYKKISSTSGNMKGLYDWAYFGRSISMYQNSSLPPSEMQILVGANDDSTRTEAGAAYLLTIDTSFYVKVLSGLITRHPISFPNLKLLIVLERLYHVLVIMTIMV